MQSFEKTIAKVHKTQALFLSTILIVFLAASIVINYLWIRDFAYEYANFIHRHARANDMREVGVTIQETSQRYFTALIFKTSRPGGSFTFPPSEAFSSSQSFFSPITTGRIAVSIDRDGDDEQITFFYNRFRLISYAVGLWLLSLLISIPQTRILKRKMAADYAKQLEIEKAMATDQVSSKVRHNIRTPLSALISLSNRTVFSNEDEAALFQSVISQIHTLISDLDTKKTTSLEAEASSIIPCLHQAIGEARLTLPEGAQIFESIDESNNSNVAFIHHELRSMLGNLINNAIEANATAINVELSDRGTVLLLKITDNGSGIPSELIDKVTQKGFSHGKMNGSGLGLHHALEQMTSWNGRLKIESKNGKGTTIQLLFPVVSRSDLYVENINLSNDDTVIVIDDQPAIHRMWKLRLNELHFAGKIEGFFSVDEAKDFLSKNSHNKVHLFVDYDLGENEARGVTIFKFIKDFKFAAMVTGHFDDEEVRTFCRKNKIGLLPKTMLPTVPISIG